MERFNVNKKQLLLGVAFLFVGTMVYLVDRPVGSTYFLQKYKSIHLFFRNMPTLYGKLGMSAPEFFHPLAFSLISMAFISNRKSKIMICFAWFSIDSIFEFGQIFGAELVEYLPKRFVTVPTIKNFVYFFVYGVFDIFDLIAIGLGSLTAFFILKLESKKGGKNE